MPFPRSGSTDNLTRPYLLSLRHRDRVEVREAHSHAVEAQGHAPHSRHGPRERDRPRNRRAHRAVRADGEVDAPVSPPAADGSKAGLDISRNGREKADEREDGGKHRPSGTRCRARYGERRDGGRESMEAPAGIPPYRASPASVNGGPDLRSPFR